MSLVSANPLLDLRRVALDPAKEGGWVNVDTALLHHLSQVSIADAVFAVPAHAQQDDLDREAAALEQRQQGVASRDVV
jgi:hypothetical protein